MAGSPEPFYREMGRKVHGFRTAKGLTQEEVGLRLDPPVTRASIANLENGRQRVLLHTAVQIAKILECALDALVPSFEESVANGEAMEVVGELRKYSIPGKARSRISRQLLVPTKKERQ